MNTTMKPTLQSLSAALLAIALMTGCEKTASNSSAQSRSSPSEPTDATSAQSRTVPVPGTRPATTAPATGLKTTALPAGHPPIPQPELPAGHPPIPQPGQAKAQSGMQGMMAQQNPGTGRISAPGAKHTTGGITYQLPKTWTEEEGQGMRFATIRAEGIDIVVNQFPGDVGGELANINRWRSQLQLPPLTQDQLPQNTQKIQTSNTTATMVDLAGDGNNERMLAAIIPDPAAGRTWFFKLYGPGKKVQASRAGFMDLIKSIQLGGQ